MIRTLSGLLMLVLCLSARAEISSDSQQEAGPERISVSYCSDCVPFHFTDESGQPAGMIVDLWRLWEKKTGITVDFREASWNETLEQVKTGKTDVHAGLFYSDERNRYLDYGDDLVETDTHVFLHNSLSSLDKLEDLSAYRVGVLEGDFVEGYLRGKILPESVVAYETYDAIIKDLKRGYLRAFAVDTPTGLYFLKKSGLLGEFRIARNQLLYSNTWRVAVTKGRKDLLAVIATGMAEITPRERLIIERRWVDMEGVATDQHALIIAVAHDDLPFARMNDQGEAVGLYADYWRLWSEKTGIPVQFVFSTWEQSIENVRRGIADLHAGLYKDERYEASLDFAPPFYQVSASLYRRAGGREFDNLASLKGLQIGVPAPLDTQYLEVLHPGLNFVPFAHYTDAIAALRTDQVQALAGEEPSMDYFLGREGLRGEIVTARLRLSTRSLRPAVAANNKKLLEDIKAGMERITLDELTGVEKRWVLDPSSRNFKRQSAAYYDFLSLLSEDEKEWLLSHPQVRLGADTSWPPFEWVEGGRLQGLSGEYFRMLQRLTNIDFVQPPQLAWSETLTWVKNRSLDMLTLAAVTPEREKYLSFTRPYLSIPQVLVQDINTPVYERLEDMPGDARIGVVKGYASVAELQSRGYGAQLVQVDTFPDGMRGLVAGQFDVFVGNLTTVNTTIRKLHLKQLQATGDAGFRLELAIGVRKDWAPLVGILNKALDSITPTERDAIYQRAGVVSSDIREFNGRSTLKQDNGLPWKALATAAVILVLLLVMAFLWFRHRDPASLFGSGRTRLIAGVVVASMLLIIILVARIGLMQVEKNLRQAQGNSIDTVLDTTQASFQAWLNGWKFRVEMLAADPLLREQAEQLLKLPASKESLSESEHLSRIRKLFHSYTDRYGDMGFFIISPSEISIGSMRDTNLGSRNLIADQAGELLERAFFGETVMVPPIQTDVVIENDQIRSTVANATMFVATPVKNAREEVIAVLTLRIDPYREFSEMAHAGRVGATGESYLVNASGTMISSSRFEAGLARLGLIGEGDSSILNISVRDPKRNLKDDPLYPYENIGDLPHTFAVDQLMKRVSGHNLEGYNDYRGVPVLGSWTWDESLGVGIITEIDKDEVLEVYLTFRNIVILILGTAVLLTLALTATTFYFGRAAHRSLTASKAELEHRVVERTSELKEREQRMWDMYENAPTPYASISPVDGRFQKHNKAFAGLLRRDRADFRELKWASLTVGDDVPDVVADVGEGAAMMDRELRIERVDGERMHVLLSALPARNGEGDIDEIRLTLIDVTERKAAEKRFASLMESAPDAMVVINEDGDLVLVNSQVEKVFGYDREELLGNKIEMLVPEAIREVHVGYRSHYFDTPETRPMGADLLLSGQRKNGEVFPVEVSLSPIQTDEGTLAVAVARDITERREVEQRVARSNRDLATLTLINEAVMQALTEDQLLYDVCRILVEANEKRFAWIGYEVRDADKSIRQMARYGYEKGFLEGLPYSWSRDETRQGPTGRAIRSARHELVRDVSNDPDYTLWRDAAVDRDYGSVLAIPLNNHGDAFGAITLYADEPDGFDEDSIEMLQRLADNVAHGVQSLRSDFKRQETEAELQETEERSRLLLESVDEGIFGLDDDGRVTFVNPAGARNVGWEPDELIGRRMHALTHHSREDGSHYPVEECPMRSSYLAGKVHHVDNEVMWRKDGSAFHVEYSSLPIHKGGKLVGAVVTYRDITERREAEARILESEKRLETAANAASLALWDLIPQTGELVVNENYPVLFGYEDPAELCESQGKWWRVRGGYDAWVAAIHPEDREWVQELAEKYLSGEEPLFHAEYRIQRKNGEALWITHTGTVSQRGPDGEPLRANGVMGDINEAKQMEAALRDAKQEAEEATRAKSDFLANMSHEIRTPMNAIIGLSHLALGTQLTRKQQDYLSKVHGSAQNLLGIINDILDFSKIEAGKLDMEATDFDLQHELDNIASVVSIKAGEKSLEFLIDHPLDLPMDLHGDPLRLGQVIINLANNAVKFTDEGSVTVRIHLLEENDDGYQMRFEVIDTGIGMTEEQMSRLFKAFSQADTSTTRKYGGTGLGLTISKRLVEMMEGEIGVESAPGTGSTFWFTARFGKAKSEVRRSLTVDADFKDLKTLVVDDNAISREILTRICESFGFDVHEAASGAEALEELGSEQNLKTPYKLVLLDWKMPGMNGMELATLVSEDPAHYGDPHMVMVSAYGREDLMQQAQDLHLDGYLVKPVNASMLFDTVMQAFGKQVESAPRAGLGDTPQAPPELRGAHLLLAEDNEINQEVATEILQQAGFRISIANNGQEALDMLDAGPTSYDGVLMDLHMPVMDGIEATENIRKQKRFAELPVLAMTAAALAEEKQRCLDAGMNAHISKPIDVPELVHTLVEWLKPVATKSDQAPDDSPVDMPAGPTAVDSLPEIEGIDSADGLRRVGGNQSLYRRLLGKYLLSQADVIERIRTALSEQDQQTATREAHTLKSVSGNIGALGIAEVAARIESTLHKGETDIEAMLAELDQVLDLVLAQLRARLGNEAPPDKTPTQPPMDPEQLRADLQQLHGLLKEMDTEANELAERLFAGLRGTEQGRIMKQVLDALSGYDFDKALSLLEGLQASTNDGSSS